MKNLVRGVVILSAFCFLAVFIYAQTRTENVSDIANDSQTKLNIKEADIETAVVNKQVKKEEVKTDQDQEKAKQPVEAGQDKKLVEKTVSAKATRGISKGKFVATAYCLRGRTASGSSVRKGIIAADPRVLRLGSKVAITGGAYSGDYVVTDTGGKIKGNRIDIWMASCAEARRFGRRTVSLSLLK